MKKRIFNKRIKKKGIEILWKIKHKDFSNIVNKKIFYSQHIDRCYKIFKELAFIEYYFHYKSLNEVLEEIISWKLDDYFTIIELSYLLEDLKLEEIYHKKFFQFMKENKRKLLLHSVKAVQDSSKGSWLRYTRSTRIPF